MSVFNQTTSSDLANSKTLYKHLYLKHHLTRFLIVDSILAFPKATMPDSVYIP